MKDFDGMEEVNNNVDVDTDGVEFTDEILDSKKSKADAREADERRSIIAKLILDGYSRADIRKNCSKLFKISQRQVENYYIQCEKEFKKAALADRDTEFKKATQRALRLYNKCLKDNDRRSAVAVFKEMNELLGLKSVKLEVTGKDKGPIEIKATRVDPSKLSDHELDVLESLVKKAEEQCPVKHEGEVS